MLSGSPVLATVFLWSVFLLAAPDQSHKKGLCSLDRIKKVESLNNMLPTQMDLSLYTPSVDDYKKCPGATLSCFADELSVLCEEMKASGLNRSQQNLNRSIRNLVQNFNKPDGPDGWVSLAPPGRFWVNVKNDPTSPERATRLTTSCRRNSAHRSRMKKPEN